MNITKRTIETKPDGTVIETIEYAPVVTPQPDPLTLFRKWADQFPPAPPTPQPHGWVPCMFDGLSDGVYGIACPCPKCSPRC